MKLHEMKSTEGSRHKRKRVGRGTGSGHGKTAGRGENGQRKRGSGKVRLGFEGGQTPLYRRLPKRGFNNYNFETKYEVINLDKINELGLKVITPEILKDKKIIKKQYDGIKILGDGELKIPVKITAHKFSKSAVEKIKKAKGEIIIIEPKKYPERNSAKVKKQAHKAEKQKNSTKNKQK